LEQGKNMSDVESNNPDAGFDASVESIEALLGPDDGNQAPENKRKQVAEQASDEPADDAEESASDESEQDEHEGTDEGDEAGDQATDTLEEVEYEGKKFKIPAELKPALLRQQDYTRKTQEVAEQRKAVEAQHYEALAIRQQYAHGLQIVQNTLQQQQPEAPTPQLWEEDPIEAARMESRYRAHAERVRAVAAEQQRVHAEAEQRHLAEREHRIRHASQWLESQIPTWKDEGKRTAEQKELAQYLKSHGYTSEEVAAAEDPRAVLLTRKAWQWDQMQKAKKTATPTAPAVMKPGTAPTRQPDSGRARVFDRARKSGRLEDAAAALSFLD
jgi:hypothetical protein